MKKWFCLMSVLVICLTICNISMAATNLTDIKGTKYEDAVENLIEIGLVNGYPEDNTYRPSVTVTRAQMAKMMVIALGEEDQVSAQSKVNSMFSDIKSGHWAYGYVNVAKNLGIINGYPDGRFGPDEIVTYAEATTMAIRALGYEEDVERSTELWPNNYTSYARKLSLYDSIGSFQAGNGATRGDVAILMWNMLRTGVCTVKGQTSNSGLIYGEGQIMLNKYKDYTYLEEAQITSVDFTDDFKEAKVVIIDANSEKLTLTLPANEVLKYFAKDLTILYDEKQKEISTIETEEKYDEEEGDVTAVTKYKITIEDDDYTLPDSDNIILYKIDKLEDAVEATVYLKGNTVEYVVATGANDIHIGLVTNNELSVDDVDGVKIKNKGSSKEVSYALIDKDEMPKKNSVIIYYLNSDEKIGIVKEIELADASVIKSYSSSQIKIGNIVYTYDSNSYVITEADGTSLKSLTYKNISKNEDMAYAYEYLGKTYLVIFSNAIEDEDKKAEAYEDLKELIEDVEEKVSKEHLYSQVSFDKFYTAYNNAKAITKNSTQIKIMTSLNDLKEANSGLIKVSTTSSEGKIAQKRSELRSLINVEAATIEKNKAKYTNDSYNAFLRVLDDAEEVIGKTDTTLSEVKDAYDALNTIIDKLVLITSTQSHKDAVALLNTAINNSKTVGAKENYTSDSYSAYKNAYDLAVTTKNNYASKTDTEIKNVAEKLNTAISRLELAVDSMRNDLNKLIADCIDYAESEEDYTEGSFVAFSKAYERAREVRNSTDRKTIENAIAELKIAIKGLQTVESALNNAIKAVEKMKTAPNVKIALGMTAQLPQDKLDKIDALEEAAINDLTKLIEEANIIADGQGTEGDGSLELAIGNAKKVLNDTSSTLSKIADAYANLKSLIK